MKSKQLIPFLLVIVISGWLVFTGSENAFGKNPDDPFYETARFIMTSEESDIYKHLPDQKTRDEFIDDFWKKRDPSPETGMNENKDEFETRIAYANKWFKEGVKGRGWDTERGRILLQLGFPDRREFGDLPETDTRGRLLTSKRIPMEVWTYYSFKIYLIFTDLNDTGRLSLYRIPSGLPTALDAAKFALDLRDKDKLKRAFKFEISVDKKNGLKIQVPAKKLTYLPIGEKMKADFGITVYVYRNSIKIDTLKMDKAVIYPTDELLNMKYLKFEIPYSPTEGGKYLFDVVIEEKGTAQKYRDFASAKF